MNIVICPLVSRDLEKAIRSVKSAKNIFPTKVHKFTTIPIINSLDFKFIDDFSKWCDENDVSYRVTESNGTAPKGKNAVLDFFRDSFFDGLSMVDGDDMCWPTRGQQIERHLLHHPSTDVLITKPSDRVDNSGVGYKVAEGYFANCWGTNFVKIPNCGPDKHDIFTIGHGSATNNGGHIFYSKKAIEGLRYDEDQLLGEDFLLEFEFLKRHQDGKIAFWLTFCSDIQLLDRTSSNSIQRVNYDKGRECFERLMKKVPEIVSIDRSSFNELPVEFPPLLFNYEQKIEWIIKNFGLPT